MRRLVFFLLLVAATIAYAGNEFNEKYGPQSWQQAFLAPQGADTVADLSSSDYANNHLFLTVSHEQTVTLHVAFQTAGANAKLRLVRGYIVAGNFYPVSTSSATVTAQSTFKLKNPAYYVADDLAFDTSNFSSALVIVESISTGNIWVTASVQ